MSEQKQDAQRWHRLDNTANLFPVIVSKRFSNVYRISLNLDEAVVPELLQRALETVLPWFAALRVRLRRGVFWHYLEHNPGVPLVQEEDDYPCRYIDPLQNNYFLFRVSYFGNRINLEIFHVLTDGTGALSFLQALCCQYLMLAHPQEYTEEQKQRRWFAQHAQDTEDSYAANYVPTRKSTFRIGRGYRLRGERSRTDALSVIHAHIALPGLLAHCRAKGVSVTHYLTACVGWAVYTQQMKENPTRWPVNIFLPVNLRGMFESSTALNFFSNIYVSLSFRQPGVTFDDLLAEVKRQFGEKISKESMLEKISYTVGSGYSPFIRVVPLPLKKIVLRVIYETSAASSTLGFSNLGSVKLPDLFNRHVAGATLLLSTAPREPFKCAAISHNDIFTLSFTSTLRSTALQRAVVRQFAKDGLSVVVESNGVDYESL